ncbi:hypothetical protein ABTE32_23185, partial [Acinetobacter baumannii]
ALMAQWAPRRSIGRRAGGLRQDVPAGQLADVADLSQPCRGESDLGASEGIFARVMVPEANAEMAGDRREIETRRSWP